MRPRNKDERSAAQKEEHRKQIAEMYFKQGCTQKEIAEKIGISQATVSRDVKELTTRNRGKADRLIKRAFEEKLTELQMVKTEAWEAWAKSQKIVITAKEIIEASEAKYPGDPRFLDQIQKAIIQECKVYGLDSSQNGIKLQPETLLLMQALGLNISDVAAAFNEMIKQAAQVQST